MSAPGRHRPPLPRAPRALQNNEKLFQGRHNRQHTDREIIFRFFAKNANELTLAVVAGIGRRRHRAVAAFTPRIFFLAADG